MNTRYTKSLVAAALLLFHSSLPLAQASQRGMQLDEIVVTAQKREESLQDTPISLLAFSGEQLQRLGVTNLGDITALVPNVDITPFPNSRSSLVIFMRGVGNNDSQTTQDPAVGVYLDGVYVGRSIGLTSDIADLERVEVLRGPQGTLYGRNTTGGAINMITAKPSGELGFKQTVNAGNRGHYKYQSQLDTPEFAGLSARASWMRSGNDGWVGNKNPGPDFLEQEKNAARLALRWDVSDSLSIDYAYDRSKIIGPQAYYQVLSINEENVDTLAVTQQILQDEVDAITAGGGTPPDALADALVGTVFVNEIFIPQFRERASSSRLGQGEWAIPVQDSDTKIAGHGLTVSWDTPWGMLKSITAYRELEESIIIDYGAGVRWFDVYVDIEQDQVSQELQLVGDIGTDFSYVAGLYYFRERGREQELGLAAGDVVEDRDIKSENEAWAIYGQLSWSLNAQLGVTLGARYTEDERRASKRSINFENSPNNTLSDSGSWSNFNPSLTVDYAWNDDVSSYAKIVTGYKSGGFNVRSTEEGFKPPFDEEEMISYEVGLKSTWWNNRLRINAAAFFSDYTDMQIQQILDNSKIFLTDVFNAGEAEIKGFELDLTALLTRGFTLNIGYGYTDAEFVKVVDNNPNSSTFGEDISADYTMPYAPKHTYTIGADYEFLPFSFGGVLRASLDYNWRDERFGTAANDDMEGFRLPSYGLLNGRLQLSEIPLWGAEMTIAAWGRNLLNEEYLVHNISQNFFRSGYFGELASYGLELIVEF